MPEGTACKNPERKKSRENLGTDRQGINQGGILVRNDTGSSRQHYCCRCCNHSSCRSVPRFPLSRTLNRPRRLPTCNLHTVAAFQLFVKCSCLGAGAQQAWHAGHEADFCLALLPPLGPRLHRPRPALQGGRQPIPGAAQGGAPRQRRGCGAAAGEPSHGCRVREKGRHWQCSVRGGREAVLICHASAPGLGTRGRWRCLLR